MKINKANWKHWLYLALFGLNTLAAMLLRPVVPRQKGCILLYGHKLNGNLLALYREAKTGQWPLQVRYLTMDPKYHAQLKKQGVDSVLAISPRTLLHLIRTEAIVSDHGLHVMLPLTRYSTIRFYDVWHGIPFKGFDAEDFRTQHRYDEVWVASPLLKSLYLNRFAFKDEQVVVTGYARTDRLVDDVEPAEEVRQRLNLPPNKRVVLFAPTWAQDSRGRNIFPFESDEATFMGALAAIAEAHHCTILLRPHLNTPLQTDFSHPAVYCLPSATHPDTEEILLASDILICDWSSIAFDFLLLGRPAIFLDVAPPFKKGFSLGPEYRYGAIVDNLEALQARLNECLSGPNRYWLSYREPHDTVRDRAYGAMADGQSARRGLTRLTPGGPSA